MIRQQQERWIQAAGIVGLVVVLGAAPAAPSYEGVNRAIANVRSNWTKPGVAELAVAPGWYAYFEAIQGELKAYTEAKDEKGRVASLDRLESMLNSLRQVGWSEVDGVRVELEQWMLPRRTLHNALGGLSSALAGFPPAQTEEDRANRAKWQSFLEERLAGSLRAYDAARTVGARQTAYEKVQQALEELRKRNGQYVWAPSVGLERALGDLVDRPNVDVTIDPSVLSATVGRRGIVNPEQIYFKGQWSTVTPGPIRTLGFLPYEGGIAVEVSQGLRSVTPIQNFQQQLAADSQGQRAARMYQFSATTQNDGVAIMRAIIGLPWGVSLQPTQLVNLSASIGSQPQAGGGLMRLFAGFLGYNQNRITSEVYNNAIGPMRQQATQGVGELSAIRTADGNAQLNAQILPYIVDGQTVGLGKLGLQRVALRSQPALAQVTGDVNWLGMPRVAGAGIQPSPFQTYEPGITVDVHLASAMTNLLRGAYEQPEVREVQSYMVETGLAASDRPMSEQVKLTPNPTDEAFYASVAAGLESKDANRRTIRIFKPEQAPVVTVDSKGRLVFLVKDLKIDIPTQPNLPPAKAYRIESPRAEFVVSVEVQPVPGNTPRVVANVEDVDLGGQSKGYMLGEGDPKPLNLVQRQILTAGLAGGLEKRTFDFQAPNLSIPGVVVTRTSPVDPSGWMRVVLTPTY